MPEPITQYKQADSVDELNALLATHEDSSLAAHWIVDGQPRFLVAVWEINPPLRSGRDVRREDRPFTQEQN